ncbi:hypothetical protein AYO20_06924 [Fonsecaea nubica]|uniref:FAD/NAD(P)-binding domain-containing protein n=1 Tax=Fonsecaea nubica TaxID=856822 RepID=A0A178CV98_9EURO|nr:hypothetical protein AYO20_06924 [Fonsecaea nubica]OAL33748.1 hypothetical protein AYO20_06924 [Fonsecaea nubica]
MSQTHVPPDEEWQLLDQWHGKKSKLRVVHIGAGVAGILMAYKMRKMMTDYELVCYDKNPEIGGTWYENRYPGCACDVPAHGYTYPFDGYADWSSFYASGPEILQYLKQFAAKHELGDFFKLNSKVIEATWDDEQGIYKVKIEQNGGIIEDYCHILVNGGGFLNNWKWPNIAGLFDFKGQLVHSASWDPTIDYAGKKVAILGTGSSAIQIVPHVQKAAQHLVAFMRSNTWISPPFGATVLGQRENDSNAAPEDFPAGPQHKFTAEEKERFRKDPEYHLRYRRLLESSFNAGFDMFLPDTEYAKVVKENMKAEMLRRLGPGHEELKEKLIPSWPPGCRRITPGEGYLEALVQPNVETVHQEIAKVVPEGVLGADGTLYPVDIIICATGFNIAFSPSFQVRGVGGVVMEEEFTPDPKVYMGFTAPKFPNFFTINGPRANWANGCYFPSVELQVEYVIKCANKMQEEGIKAMEVKPEVIDHLYRYHDAWHRKSTYSAPCKSWYKRGNTTGTVWVWGGSGLHYLKAIKEPKFEHYNYTYKNSNMFAYFGNGRLELEWKGEQDKMAPYIRNGDVPWDFE